MCRRLGPFFLTKGTLVIWLMRIQPHPSDARSQLCKGLNLHGCVSPTHLCPGKHRPHLDRFVIVCTDEFVTKLVLRTFWLFESVGFYCHGAFQSDWSSLILMVLPDTETLV